MSRLPRANFGLPPGRWQKRPACAKIETSLIVLIERKPMNKPSQQPLLSHRNHYLFSDYYLANRLPEQPEWAADVAPALADLTALWRSYQPQADNESQTEADWIRPVLTRLGHRFNVQVALDTPFGTRKPDYVLFADEAGRQACGPEAPVRDSPKADLREGSG